MKIITIIIFTILLSIVSCSNPQITSPHDQFRGMWKLYIIEYQDSTGIWQEHAWNKGGDSYIMYDGLGHMAVQITPEGYKDYDVKLTYLPRITSIFLNTYIPSSSTVPTLGHTCKKFG